MKKEDLDSLNLILENRDPKIDAIKKIDTWKKQYYEQLLDYKYIHTIDEFKKLQKGGIIKIISLKNEELKKGGIILDIKKNYKNKWYALVGITNKNILWKIYFNDNYIFFREQYTLYKNNKETNRMTNFMNSFIPQNEIGKIKSAFEPNENVEYLYNKYVKKNENN